MKANLLKMMTTYNLALIALYATINTPPARDFIAALSFIIFIGYTITIMWYGYMVVIPMYTTIFQNLLGKRFVAPFILIVVVDVVVHIVPTVMFGIPTLFIPFCFACLFVATWYTLVRKHIQDIYMLPYAPVYKRDLIVYGGLVSLIGIAYTQLKKG